MKPRHTIILEEASLELVPRKFRNHNSCKLVTSRLGVLPAMQILDQNYHHEIIRGIPNCNKRGRPDIVHFALLDISSTPAFTEELVEVYVHTILNQTIKLKPGVRLPRTLHRFCGVIAKVLSGNVEGKDAGLFELNNDETLLQLLSRVAHYNVVCLTTEGDMTNILSYVKSLDALSRGTTWILGGYAHGHFRDDVKAISTDIVSISKHHLPAHVVASRLCFSIELSNCE